MITYLLLYLYIGVCVLLPETWAIYLLHKQDDEEVEQAIQEMKELGFIKSAVVISITLGIVTCIWPVVIFNRLK